MPFQRLLKAIGRLKLTKNHSSERRWSGYEPENLGSLVVKWLAMDFQMAFAG